MFAFSLEDFIKILLAVLIGGVIGFERELHSKAAGLRTITLITVGATLFTLLSGKFADADRVAASIVSGVGFLGAGAILFSEGKVKGLTTASSIWTAAAIGMAIGIGQYLLAMAVAVLVVIVLGLFARFDHWVDLLGRETRTYEVIFADRDGKFAEIDQQFHACHLHIREVKRFKQSNALAAQWDVDGRTKDHACLAEKLLADKEIKELRY